jgi:hypothetical protein
MAYGSPSRIPPAVPSMLARTLLNRQQIVGFWAAWFGWMLDGMDSVIYALVLGPAMTELLPRSGMQASPANIGFVGSIMFALRSPPPSVGRSTCRLARRCRPS